jgi:ATP-dependent DNA helicase RecG
MSEDRAGQVTAVRDGEMAVRLVKSLGFELTVAQRRVDGEIAADMAAGGSMRRLLQGDVGSGKTVIAALAVSRAVEAGFQAAMMAPTELLARQHAAVLGKMLSPLGIRTVLLAAGEEEAGRTKALEGLRDGSIAFAVGTHALIQESVVFDRLGLAVVDEQHRFGVRQRLALKQKGGSPDLLAMTATPIPRTLCLACYGDFDVSVLDELPPGRKPVATVIRREEERGAVLAEIKRELAAGRRVFVVFPAVDEDARGNLRAATAAARRLRREVSPGARVGLLHGRMDSRKRQGVMESFRRGETRLLVATTVIEVGVDVPEATLLVVEQAERFGLSQLHQLRGRVGRGDLPSQCVLMVSGEVGDEAMKRVRVAAEEGDGFRIAEADLALRGPGDFLGTRQAGIPALRVADLAAHGNLLPQAREEAAHLLARDADLAAPRHRELRLAANDLWKGKYHLAAAG